MSSPQQATNILNRGVELVLTDRAPKLLPHQGFLQWQISATCWEEKCYAGTLGLCAQHLLHQAPFDNLMETLCSSCLIFCLHPSLLQDKYLQEKSP